MTTRRASLRMLVAVAIALLGTSLLVHGAASAFEQESMTVPARATAEAEYPPIAANDPATVTVDHTLVTPDECRQLPSCALVPLDIEAPVVDPGDDFYVILTISWDVTDISDNNVQPVKSNDLDTFLYDDGQIRENSGLSAGYTEVGSSASGDMPEVIKAFEPVHGRYNLVVVNFAGGNTGWHLKAESLVGKFDKPIESLTPAGGTQNPGNKPTTTTTTRPPSTTSTSSTVTVPEGVVIPDDDFEGGAFEPTNDFQDQLLADAEEINQAIDQFEPGSNDGSSPSALTVLGWMLVFPAIIIGAGFFLITRNRRNRRSKPTTAAAA
jgi:hypothetical protein